MITFRFRHEFDPDFEPGEFSYTDVLHISSHKGMDDQVWDMARVLSRTSALVSDVTFLEITAGFDFWRDHDNMDNVERPDLFLL